eukprot:6095679-Amphidinium_carterae.2
MLSSFGVQIFAGVHPHTRCLSKESDASFARTVLSQAATICAEASPEEANCPQRALVWQP